MDASESSEASHNDRKFRVSVNEDPEKYFFLRTERKVLTGCLGPIIMHKLNEITVSRPADIISSFRNYSIDISSGTIYPAFNSLEVNGNIIRLPNKTNRLYILTPKGKHAIDYFKSNLPVILEILDKLLK